MSDELPPPAPPVRRPEDDEDELLFAQPPPRASWRPWLIGGLVVVGVLGLGAVGYMLYSAGVVWQRQFGWQGSGLAPATAPGAGPFREVAKLRLRDATQALGGGDVDGDGQGEGIVWAGKTLALYDRAGKPRASFPSGLKAIGTTPVGGGMMPALPGGGVRRPLVGVLQDQPALAVTDGEGESLFAFRADGTRALALQVANTHVRCFTLADLEGDGESELLVGRSSAVGLICSDSFGRTRWKHGAPTDPAWVQVGDGNADGQPDVFVGYQTGAVHILDARGKRIGQWPHWMPTVTVDCADLDGDRRADFLLGRPQNPTYGSGGGAGSSSSYGGLGLGVDLAGVAADGTEKWTWPLAAAGYWLSTSHLDHADLDLNGKSEWIASAPDGTVRVYDVAGSELGSFALGQQVGALAVVPGASGEKPQVWVGLRREVRVLEWQ